MRLVRAALAVCLALLSALVIGSPARAGNWAVTALDPLPRIEPGTPYTVGFWVLQHGSHPYSGTLDPVALKLVRADGKTLTFEGVPLKEPAHYAAAVSIPAGRWTVVGVQGIFADYQVGTLTVPGGLTVLDAPPPMQVPASERPWREIHPPKLAIDHARSPFSPVSVEGAPAGGRQDAAPAGGSQGAANRADGRPSEETPLPPVGLVALAVGLPLAALGLFVTRRTWLPRLRLRR